MPNNENAWKRGQDDARRGTRMSQVQQNNAGMTQQEKKQYEQAHAQNNQKK